MTSYIDYKGRNNFLKCQEILSLHFPIKLDLVVLKYVFYQNNANSWIDT